MPQLLLPGALVLLAVAGLAAWDGLYYHLWRFRLFARPASRREHLTHTVRALLTGPLLLLLFVVPVQGPLLWFTLGLALADFMVLVWDVFEEDVSRRELGGLPRVEYRIHIVAATLHAVGLTLAFAAQPQSAWHATSRVAEPLPDLVVKLGLLMAPGSMALGVLHLLLLIPAVSRNVNRYMSAAKPAT